MNIKEVRSAISEATRFIKAAKELIDELEASKEQGSSGTVIYVGTAKSGAMRRASLDLTRQLAKMRRPS